MFATKRRKAGFSLSIDIGIDIGIDIDTDTDPDPDIDIDIDTDLPQSFLIYFQVVNYNPTRDYYTLASI